MSAHKTHLLKSLIPIRFSSLPPFDIIRGEVATPEVASIWDSFIRLILSGVRGPFHSTRTEDNLDYLTAVACRLFPHGLPSYTWIPLYDDLSAYGDFF